MRPGRASSLFPLLLILALAAGSFWLERAVQVPGYDKSGKMRHDPDFIAEDFGITKLDASGKPEYILSAEHMEHYPDDESTSVVAPRLVRRHVDANPVVISADRALIAKNGDEANFYGNVLVVREAGRGQSELRVQTDFLQVVPDLDLARTDKPVTVTEGQSRLSGVGMEFNSKTRQFVLRSQVRGTYNARN